MKRKHFFLLSITFYTAFLFAQERPITVDFLTGKKNEEVKQNTLSLLPEVAIAFSKMQQAALRDGINIEIVSSYRSFERQQLIFNRKYQKYRLQGLDSVNILKKIIEYSTIPGTSRHHWGTDFDIIQKVKNTPKNLLLAENYENEGGAFCEMKEWMDKHANAYGFYLVYTNTANRTGFKYEPWHYSYAPISKNLLAQFLNKHQQNEIYTTIKKAGIPVTYQFFNDYIKTHIKGVHPELLSDL